MRKLIKRAKKKQSFQIRFIASFDVLLLYDDNQTEEEAAILDERWSKIYQNKGKRFVWRFRRYKHLFFLHPGRNYYRAVQKFCLSSLSLTNTQRKHFLENNTQVHVQFADMQHANTWVYTKRKEGPTK